MIRSRLACAILLAGLALATGCSSGPSSGPGLLTRLTHPFRRSSVETYPLDGTIISGPIITDPGTGESIVPESSAPSMMPPPRLLQKPQEAIRMPYLPHRD